MVFLSFSDKYKARVELLNSMDESIVAEFCSISAESFNREISAKALNAAAAKLNIQLQELKDLIDLITWILVESSKLNLNEKEVKESLILVGIREEIITQIQTSLDSNADQIKSYLSKMKLDTLKFYDLEWRVDLKMASRSLKKQIEPEIMLKFDLKSDRDDATGFPSVNSNNVQTKVLQTDIVNLNNLTSSLEEALNEIKTNYVRRVLRNVV